MRDDAGATAHPRRPRPVSGLGRRDVLRHGLAGAAGAVGLMLSGRAFAWSEATIDPFPTLKTPDGFTPWSLLRTVHAPGDGGPRIVPAEVRALAGTPVRLRGFVFPTSEAAVQRQFILAAYPAHCMYCMPGGAPALVYVEAPDGVPFTDRPTDVEGRFALVTDDPYFLFELRGARAV